MKFIDKNTIKLDKVKTELDEFAFRFCSILEKHTKYVIISGYVAILFGRSRATEDVDMFIQQIDKKQFNGLFKELKKNGFECITASMKQAFENLSEDMPIRFAVGKIFIPNMEVKFARKLVDVKSLTENLRVITSFGHVYVSYIEPQIAFKRVCLGSDKDLEDARHLEKVFEGKIDKEKIKNYQTLFSR